MNGSWREIRGEAGALLVYSSGHRAAPGERPAPLAVLCHDLPRVPDSSRDVGRTLPGLVDRLATESGWRVATATLRGAGQSPGDFSVGGWLDDLRVVVSSEIGRANQVWLVGLGLGGALSLRLAAHDQRVRGVACLGTAADLSGWTAQPAALVERCRSIGVITDPRFPPDLAAWADELAGLRPAQDADGLGDRPLLVIQGTDDADVPTEAARAISDGARGPVDLRIVYRAGHWLQADPRVVATLIGWLERQR